MLTKEQKSCAEHYALAGWGKEDVEYLLKCKWEELPKEFHEYVEEVKKEYNAYCARMY